MQMFSSGNKTILVETVTYLLPYLPYRLAGFSDSTLGNHSSVQNEQISTWVHKWIAHFWNTAHKRLDMPEERSLCCWIILMATSVWHQAWLVYPIEE